jgi:hypothetical protein
MKKQSRSQIARKGWKTRRMRQRIRGAARMLLREWARRVIRQDIDDASKGYFER